MACKNITPSDFSFDYKKTFPKTTKNIGFEQELNDPSRRAVTKFKELYKPSERIISNSFILG